MFPIALTVLLLVSEFSLSLPAIISRYLQAAALDIFFLRKKRTTSVFLDLELIEYLENIANPLYIFLSWYATFLENLYIKTQYILQASRD